MVPLADVTHLWTVTVVERSLQEALGSWFIFPWGQLCQAWNTNKQGKIFQNSYMMTGCTASWHVMAGNSGILMSALKGRSCRHPQLLEHHVFFLPWQVQMSAVFIVAALRSYYSVLEDMVTASQLIFQTHLQVVQGDITVQSITLSHLQHTLIWWGLLDSGCLALLFAKQEETHGVSWRHLSQWLHNRLTVWLLMIMTPFPQHDCLCDIVIQKLGVTTAQTLEDELWELWPLLCDGGAHLCYLWRGFCLVDVAQHMRPVLEVNTNLWAQMRGTLLNSNCSTPPPVVSIPHWFPAMWHKA